MSTTWPMPARSCRAAGPRPDDLPDPALLRAVARAREAELLELALAIAHACDRAVRQSQPRREGTSRNDVATHRRYAAEAANQARLNTAEIVRLSRDVDHLNRLAELMEDVLGRRSALPQPASGAQS